MKMKTTFELQNLLLEPRHLLEGLDLEVPGLVTLVDLQVSMDPHVLCPQDLMVHQDLTDLRMALHDLMVLQDLKILSDLISEDVEETGWGEEDPQNSGEVWMDLEEVLSGLMDSEVVGDMTDLEEVTKGFGEVMVGRIEVLTDFGVVAGAEDLDQVTINYEFLLNFSISIIS